jgi:hypothetical protein
LAQQLESPEPFTIQFQSGQSFDLYFANIGQDYIVSIFFDAQARRGRLGTVWVFAQRAINDLRDLLALNQLVDLPTAPQPDELVLPETAEAEAPTPAAEAVEEPVEAVLETAETTESAEPDDEAVDLESTQEIVPPSLEDIRAFLGIEEPGEAEEVDLDSFWDDALEESGKGKLNSSGMSLEEARKQGLIPTEFDQQGRPKEPD